MSVTMRSTIAMVFHPIIAHQFGFDDRDIGIFIDSILLVGTGLLAGERPVETSFRHTGGLALSISCSGSMYYNMETINSLRRRIGRHCRSGNVQP